MGGGPAGVLFPERRAPGRGGLSRWPGIRPGRLLRAGRPGHHARWHRGFRDDHRRGVAARRRHDRAGDGPHGAICAVSLVSRPGARLCPALPRSDVASVLFPGRPGRRRLARDRGARRVGRHPSPSSRPPGRGGPPGLGGRAHRPERSPRSGADRAAHRATAAGGGPPAERPERERCLLRTREAERPARAGAGRERPVPRTGRGGPSRCPSWRSSISPR